MKITCNRAEKPVYDNNPKVLPLVQKIIDLAVAEGATIDDLLTAIQKVKSSLEENQRKLLVSKL